ncbi:hypothetical protein KC678_00590 [Candidatus Dojkabacteria bacterium]|uniref:Uncharacterized protein n=1 Tax=Candidatus Dojkabacteria bacterium TaxID=2099670 RepID=A0A955L099_9BACT|nr:hypothetical protein [Candidatus Dojkabacteria bacterium]
METGDFNLPSPEEEEKYTSGSNVDHIKEPDFLSQPEDYRSNLSLFLVSAAIIAGGINLYELTSEKLEPALFAVFLGLTLSFIISDAIDRNKLEM